MFTAFSVLFTLRALDMGLLSLLASPSHHSHWDTETCLRPDTETRQSGGTTWQSGGWRQVDFRISFAKVHYKSEAIRGKQAIWLVFETVVNT